MSFPNLFPLREICPSGWIENSLKTQAAGLISHPSVHGYPFGQKFWGSPNSDMGLIFTPPLPTPKTLQARLGKETE